MDFAESVYQFFVCLVRYAVGLVRFALVEIVNEVLAIIYFVASIIGYVIPPLNFAVPEIPSDTLSYINWLFPVGFLVPLYTSCFTAYGIYRVLRFLSRRNGGSIRPRL